MRLYEKGGRGTGVPISHSSGIGPPPHTHVGYENPSVAESRTTAWHSS